MTTPEFPQEQAAGAPSNLASWGTRAIGALIDALPILILQAVTFWSTPLRVLVGLVSFVYFYLYLGYLDGMNGQTPGKMVMGTRLVNAEGNVIGSGNGIARKFVHIVDSIICLLGWLLPLVDEKKQTIADKVMNTYVVEGVEKKPFAVDLYMPKS
ncbi:MAG: RDD family protein [Acidimicrobiia bacterium]|nr:RDD family protein [Acidimicrobiia bacterium]MDH3462204.1 RDD family protein [Acidimicrobiia bacterium]